MKTSNHLFNKRLFPSTRGGGRVIKSRELHRVSEGESSASTTTDINVGFATPSTTKRTMAEMWGSKSCGDYQ